MTVKLQDLFFSLQQQLATELGINRTVISHPGAKGEAAELDWLHMLEAHIPSRYQIGKAFVIDAAGDASDQIDLVLYDRQYTPILFNKSGQLFVPAESVYAVFEVKQALNRETVKYAGAKAASVRRLKRTTAPICHAGGTFDPKEPSAILGGILCTVSEWNPPLGPSLLDALGELHPEERLDFGCVVTSGSFEAIWSGDQPISLAKNDKSKALVGFFFGLLSRLQKEGTVPAIDYSVYERALRADV